MQSPLALVTLAVLGAAVGSFSSTVVAQEPAAASSEAKAPPKVWGLAFGIDAYPGGNALPNCVNDAKDMIALLRQNGVPQSQLVLMTDKQCERKAMLDALADLAKRSKAGDEVMVYFSGHGSHKKDENGDEADGADETWVTVDLDQILDDELEAAFAKIPGTVYVISDSCHSGTVSKDIQLDRSDSIGKDFGKYLSPVAISKARGNEGGFVPRDVAVERRQRQESQNAQGGACSPECGIATQVRLFSSCSDHEVSNASGRERNSAFTGQLLAVLTEANGPMQFGHVHQQVTVRLRNRAYRYPQNPALFQLQQTQAVPAWLCGTQRPAAPVAAMSEAMRGRLAAVVDGLLRREDSAANQRRDWIQTFRTESGKTEGKTGDFFGLQVQLAKEAPQQTWLCVFNVGPTGNLTLLYPNGFDGNQPLGPGQWRNMACEVDNPKYGFKLKDASGEESLVVFALEWNPFEGVDWKSLADTDHAILSIKEPVAGRAAAQQQQAMMRSRDVGVERRRARPGEGWDRATLKLTHH
jgi:hypothetical protein